MHLRTQMAWTAPAEMLSGDPERLHQIRPKQRSFCINVIEFCFTMRTLESLDRFKGKEKVILSYSIFI